MTYIMYISNLAWLSLVCSPLHSNAQLLIVGDTLSSSTTYVNIDDTILHFIARSYSTFDIDIDYDGIKDIRFFRAHDSSPMFQSETFSIGSLTSIEFVVTYPASADLDSLVTGTVVDKNLTWNENYGGAYFYFYINYAPPPPWGPPDESHGICTKPDTYIGFRKINPADTLYGWFNLDLLVFRIKSYAIDRKIYFGNDDGVVDLPLFSVYPNPSGGVIHIRNYGIHSQKIELSVFTMQGLEILHENLDYKDQYRCDLSGIADGIYLIFLKTDRGQSVQKFILEKRN